MGPTETQVHGTLRDDGTLVLDEKPNLPAGRVTVVLQRAAEFALPMDDPFWRRMQSMWDAQNAGGHVRRSLAEIESQQQEMHEGWAKRQDALERLQEVARRSRQSDGDPP